MARPQRVIVGLGNPGPDYAATRHNVGFMVVDAVAEKLGLGAPRQVGCASLLAEARWRGRSFVLAKPQTFMNVSGQAVRSLLRTYGLTPGDVLVVYDDLNLPLGALRLRGQGSAGGHNGMQDIIEVLGTDAFPRLRMGIGSDFPRGGQVRYVLSPFGADDLEARDAMVAQAVEAALTFVTDGLTAAMNRYNKG